MITALLYILLFAICGILISEVVFHKHAFLNRLWLGLTIGLLLLTWLPSLFALIIGFTVLAQILACVLVTAAGTVCLAVLLSKKRRGYKSNRRFNGSLPVFLLVTVPVIVLGAVLLHTHILMKHSDGSIWVGQVTYGDLAMHLGFITSIAEQTTFPPQYSIFPGHALNYPFLCETSGATLYQLGASPRQAYILSAMYAFVLVVFGIYLFFRQWLKKDSRAALATVLFFFGSGFGFFYFFDLAKSGGLLSYVIGTRGQTVSEVLMDGFYDTPTNLPALGLRWVNPIVDMLIPQRATLFGWAFLFPCLYLLHGFAFEHRHDNVLPLAVIAGLLPLIHTHSFLALGVISAVYCITDLISVRFEKTRLIRWAAYAVITCILAAPQLLLFTFRQTAESSLVRIHLNWANNADSYLWFYIKNLGMIILLMPFAFLLLSGRDRRIYGGVLVLWLLAEFVAFQPNDYDNNKLLFICFAFTCALVAKWLCILLHRAHRLIKKRFTVDECCHTDRICIHLFCAGFLLYFLCRLVKGSPEGIAIPAPTAFTLFFLCGFLLTLTVRSFLRDRSLRNFRLLLVPFVFACYWLILTIAIWRRQYTETEYRFAWIFILLGFALTVVDLVIAFLRYSMQKTKKQLSFGSLALTIAGYLLIFVMTVSSVMTMMREIKSKYQVYTAAEAELSEQIKEQTEPDEIILANSYHWNLVTPLTGRSIVTGTGTFLYYHGINNTQREYDVRSMYEQPQENRALFEQYGVRYILVSNAERNNYEIDYHFLETQCSVAAQNCAGTLYRLP